MKKAILIILITATSFCFGFAFKAITSEQNTNPVKMKRVTGIGGVFFKCKDPKAINAWYKTHLGFETSPYGTSFNGVRWKTVPKKGLPNGIPFRKKQSISSLLQKTL